MKVTFVLPLNANLTPGGAEQQAFQTAHELKLRGVEVAVLSPLSTSLGDIVHAFGPYIEFDRIQTAAKNQNIPFLLSTIFYKDFSPFETLKYRSRSLISGHENRNLGKLLRRSDFLLPNTAAECRLLSQLHHISADNVEIIPNGAEFRFSTATAALFRETHSIAEPFILNVGRVEKRKNQARLAEAAKILRKPLVVIGQKQDPVYFQEMLDRGGEFVKYLGPLPHEDPLLASAYAACEVFALPSTLETPGIAALEAGLAGAKIVVTPVGGAKEYFADHAFYPTIKQVSSIVEALQKAWETPRSPALKARILAQYSWASIAERTHLIYQKVLGQKFP